MRFNGLNRPLRLVSSIAVGLLVTTALVYAIDKAGFQPKPAEQYPNKMTSDGVTIAAEAYLTDEQTKEAFDKVNPYKFGVLPVLVVVHNTSSNAIRAERLKFVYELPDRTKLEAIPASDVKYSGTKGPRAPKSNNSPLGGILRKGNKNPLAAPEIETRAFAARMIPPGDTASGFVYFETDVTSAGAQLYISGFSNAATGKELLYFEIPFSSK